MKKAQTPLNKLKMAQIALEKAKKDIKPKQKTLTALKKDADQWFSRYIRLRDAIEQNGEWVGSCVTCETSKPIKELQAGHFVSRGKLITRYHLQNVHIQDARCNMFNQGEQYAHSKYIDGRYGEGTADSLVRKSSQTVKMTRGDYEKIIYDCKKYILEKNGSLSF